jgi:glucuronate isomerase
MSEQLRKRIFEQLDALVLIDPHTHINPRHPASATLADILGYHYYTELAHSAGMPKEQIEEPGLDPKEKCARLFANLGPLENTIQYSWLVEMAQALFGLESDRIASDNWEAVYDVAAQKMAGDDWAGQVLQQSKLEAVFLTNDFDDPLEGFDTRVYVPCLRTDDLVFHLAKAEVRQRLEAAAGVSVHDAGSLRDAIGKRFEHFVAHNAKACAISLPPDFSPTRISPGRAETAVREICSAGPQAHPSHRQALSHYVFWTLAEYCAECRLPFDLMIGVNRGVYEAGVYQGQDLYDSRVSLIQYKELFNRFPQVVFPVSVLASVSNQELTSYAWIFPNVVTNGHWWYSNTPAFIEQDLAARLEAVPRTKQIGYYSDMYKLEFALPKFKMYKRILAKVLAERFVIDRGWSEERAVDLGQCVLRDNVERIFAERAEMPARAVPSEVAEEPWETEEPPQETVEQPPVEMHDEAAAETLEETAVDILEEDSEAAVEPTPGQTPEETPEQAPDIAIEPTPKETAETGPDIFVESTDEEAPEETSIEILEEEPEETSIEILEEPPEKSRGEDERV